MSTLNFDQEQRSLDWFRSRLGVITGSQVGVLMKSGRGKEKVFGETALSYMYQLAGELSLNPAVVADDEMFNFYLDQTTSQSKAMRFGSEQEENARATYMQVTGRSVEVVGLCPHPQIAGFASSPDGIVYDNGNVGCLEIKCPSLATFSRYCAEIHDGETLRAVNPDYFYQCQAHMACTDSSYTDFVTYCPFVANPIHIVRVERDEDAISAMTERVLLAKEIINSYYNQLKSA